MTFTTDHCLAFSFLQIFTFTQPNNISVIFQSTVIRFLCTVGSSPGFTSALKQNVPSNDFLPFFLSQIFSRRCFSLQNFNSWDCSLTQVFPLNQTVKVEQQFNFHSKIPFTYKCITSISYFTYFTVHFTEIKSRCLVKIKFSPISHGYHIL